MPKSKKSPVDAVRKAVAHASQEPLQVMINLPAPDAPIDARYPDQWGPVTEPERISRVRTVDGKIQETFVQHHGPKR